MSMEEVDTLLQGLEDASGKVHYEGKYCCKQAILIISLINRYYVSKSPLIFMKIICLNLSENISEKPVA